MISLLGFRMVRSDGRIHTLGCFHIGWVAYFVWALPPNAGDLPKGTVIETLLALSTYLLSYPALDQYGLITSAIQAQ
jgi:hypothetical protein